MYHTIRFTVERKIDIELSPRQPLECVLVEVDTRLRVQVRPYVVETRRGPVEVADLFFEDGTSTRTIPFAYFSFVD